VHEPGQDGDDPALARPGKPLSFYTLLDWFRLVSRAAMRS